MVDLTAGSRKQLWNRFTIYGLLAVILAFVSESPVDSFKQNDAPDCSGLRTCTKCTENPSCNWSLKRQTCENTPRKPELLTVNIRAHCPQFTVVDSFVYKIHPPFEYKVTVSNDVSGFMKYLRKTNITCSTMGATYTGAVNEEDDTIDCAWTGDAYPEFNEQRLQIYHYSVAFDGVPLRFDDGVNNYFTVYNNTYCDTNTKTKQCVVCSWDSKHYTFYYKRCLAGNSCTGLFEYYDRRNATADIATDTAADDLAADVRTSGAQNDYDPAAAEQLDGPSPDACPDMTVRSVEPLSAPWSGGVTLVITVKNHEVLAESRKMTVTVAGRDCVYPKTVNGETISCTVGPPKPDDSVAGPVRVTYGPLRLTSAHTFRFVYPELTDLSPTCGPVTGGTLMRIAGRYLDSGSTATVSVGPDNVPCELVARYEDHVLCVTGPSDGPAAGPVTVVFDKYLRQTVGANGTTAAGPVQFIYAGDPVLEARQPFSGIASGGTYVPVRGRHLACVTDPALYVDDPKGGRQFAGCQVRNDTFMQCRSPGVETTRSPAADGASLLNFGFRVHFAGHTLDLSPQPDFPGYRLYADPVFEDFETDGVNVTINGRRLDRGYRPSVDLAIRLRNANGARCSVVETQRRQIVCVRPPPSSVAADSDLRELYVTIGREFIRTVKKKNNGSSLPGNSFGVFHAFLLIVGVLSGACFVSCLVAVVYLAWNNNCDILRNF